MILKIIICIISLFLIAYRIGIIIAHYTKNKEIVEIFLYGLISFFAILQIVLLPSILIHTTFIVPYSIVVFIIIVILIISFNIVKFEEEKNIWRITFESLKNKKKYEKLSLIFAIILIIVQAFISTYLFRENADDAYYVSLAKQSIDSEALYMEAPSLGIKREYPLFTASEQISTYELGIAIIAKTFDIEPTIMFHSILPFVFIIFSYIAYYCLAKKITNKKNAKIFLVLLSLIFLFTGFSSKFRTGCLLYKIWQGKAAFLNIGLTSFYALMIERITNKNRQLLILITINNIACVFLSSSAIFIIAFAYIGFGVINLLKKQWKETGKLVLTSIPILIYAILLIILMKTVSLQTEMNFIEQNIKDSVLLYGSIKYLILYIISVIVISIIGKKEVKIFFVWIPLINLVTIWNPLFSNFIAKYFTSSSTLWRVLWLLPIEITIAYAVSLTLTKIKSVKYKAIFTILSISVIVICGKFVYTKENGFKMPENFEKIPQYIIDQTNYILHNSEKDEKIMVMAPGEPLHSCTMRQLSSKIELLYSRMMYFEDVISEEEKQERLELCKIYQMEKPDYPQEQFNNKIEKFGINWIIIPKKQESERYLSETIMKKVVEIEGYDIYNIER